MHCKRIVLAVGSAVAASALALSTAPAASAHTPAAPLQVTKTLSTAYIGPLQFAVKGHKILVADAFASTLNLLGRSAPLATNPGEGSDISGVAWGRDGSYAYTQANGDHSATSLVIVSKYGKRTVDLARFEQTHNPDKINTYGTTSTDPCVLAALAPDPNDPFALPPTYTGIKDSHPYAVAAADRGAWIVADAGGNDILKVDRWGKISVVAVLPPQPVVVTQEMATQFGAPACVVGTTFRFEPVPTDVEFAPNGRLYATTLGSGAPSSVYKIDRGHVHKLVGGLAGATNLAIDNCGNIFVAELFGGTGVPPGQVSEIVAGTRTAVPVAQLPAVVGLEWANGRLYASTAPAALAEEGPGAPAPPGPPPFGSLVILGHAPRS